MPGKHMMQGTSGASAAADAAQWPPSPASKLPQTLRERLDHRPTLSRLQVCLLHTACPGMLTRSISTRPLARVQRSHTSHRLSTVPFPLQDLICIAVAVLLCAGVYAYSHPAGVSVRYAACIALLFGATLLAARAIALERSYEVRARQPSARCLQYALIAARSGTLLFVTSKVCRVGVVASA